MKQIKDKLRLGKNIAKVTIKELTSAFISAKFYSLGLFKKNQFEDEIPITNQQASKQYTRPVLLVHGVGHNASAFIYMQARMKKQGWIHVFTMTYKTLHGDILKMVEELALQVDKVIKITGASQIDIVAHSLGGIVARYYMSLGPGQGKIKNLVTLGTAHKGTYLSHFLKIFSSTKDLCIDLHPNSKLLKTLQQTTLPKNSQITSIYSQYDWAIWPQKHSIAEGSPSSAFKNIKVDFVGHIGLLHNFGVLQHILNGLRN